MLLGYDPDLLSLGKVTEVLVAYGIVLRATEAETEVGGTRAAKLAGVLLGHAVDSLAEWLALAMITALARRAPTMPMRERLVAYYRAVAARGRGLLTRATTPWLREQLGAEIARYEHMADAIEGATEAGPEGAKKDRTPQASEPRPIIRGLCNPFGSAGIHSGLRRLLQP